MARFMSLTYGVLPTREQFEQAYDRECTNPLGFAFRNDKRIGSDNLTCSELWREVCKATEEFHKDTPVFDQTDNANDKAGDWVSSVLGVLGIEWV